MIFLRFSNIRFGLAFAKDCRLINKHILASQTLPDLHKIHDKNLPTFDFVNHCSFLNRILRLSSEQHESPQNNYILPSVTTLLENINKLSNFTLVQLLYMNSKHPEIMKIDTGLLIQALTLRSGSLNLHEINIILKSVLELKLEQQNKGALEIMLKKLKLFPLNKNSSRHTTSEQNSSSRKGTSPASPKMQQQLRQYVYLFSGVCKIGLSNSPVARYLLKELKENSDSLDEQALSIIVSDIQEHCIDKDVKWIQQTITNNTQRVYSTKYIAIIVHVLSQAMPAPDPECIKILTNKFLAKVSRKQNNSSAFEKIEQEEGDQSLRIQVNKYMIPEMQGIDCSRLLLGLHKLNQLDQVLFEVLEANFMNNIQKCENQTIVTYLIGHSKICMAMISMIALSNSKSYYARIMRVKKYNNSFYNRIFTFMLAQPRRWSAQDVISVMTTAGHPRVSNKFTKRLAQELLASVLKVYEKKELKTKEELQGIEKLKRLSQDLFQGKEEEQMEEGVSGSPA